MKKKIRVWSKKDKVFHYLHLIDLLSWVHFGDTYDLQTGNGPFKIENEEIHYGTGILDSKGEEIFEGDVVREKFAIFDQNVFVKWEGARHKWSIPSCSDAICEFEIIGNIFENPELLEKK